MDTNPNAAELDERRKKHGIMLDYYPNGAKELKDADIAAKCESLGIEMTAEEVRELVRQHTVNEAVERLVRKVGEVMVKTRLDSPADDEQTSKEKAEHNEKLFLDLCFAIEDAGIVWTDLLEVKKGVGMTFGQVLDTAFAAIKNKADEAIIEIVIDRFGDMMTTANVRDFAKERIEQRIKERDERTNQCDKCQCVYKGAGKCPRC